MRLLSMADSTRLETEYHDVSEAQELRIIAHDLAARSSKVQGGDISRRLRQFDTSFIAARHPAEAERRVETFARSIRRIWLEAAAHEAASVFRSPTSGEAEYIARNHDVFGYERDLQPETLEARCRDFFPPPPAGWSHDHLIFSSGQAAMTSALLVLGKHLTPGANLRLTHRGVYFETKSLIRALPFIQEATSEQTADVILDEPVCCDGQVHQTDTSELLAASPRAVIFDTTLLGRDDGVDPYLAALDRQADQIVLRVTSCLKLFESGLELANAGILSIYTRSEQAGALCDDLRRIRTLTGAGLHLVDAIALEAPCFLDASLADGYAQAVFDHNARLARAVAEANKRFAPVSHPSLQGSAAPYCAFQLPDASPADYEALEHEIAEEADRRRLNLAHGGSFGFRGHRFEVVKPETGEPPFLRMAMGRRGGWSCYGVIEMMAEIAGR